MDSFSPSALVFVGGPSSSPLQGAVPPEELGRGGGRWSPTGPGSGRTGSNAGTWGPATRTSGGARRQTEGL